MVARMSGENMRGACTGLESGNVRFISGVEMNKVLCRVWNGWPSNLFKKHCKKTKQDDLFCSHMWLHLHIGTKYLQDKSQTLMHRQNKHFCIRHNTLVLVWTEITNTPAWTVCFTNLFYKSLRVKLICLTALDIRSVTLSYTCESCFLSFTGTLTPAMFGSITRTDLIYVRLVSSTSAPEFHA